MSQICEIRNEQFATTIMVVMQAPATPKRFLSIFSGQMALGRSGLCLRVRPHCELLRKSGFLL